MDKVNGNYLTQANKDFPLDCETLDYIAKNAAMIEMLGNIGGDKIILSGCEVNNLYRSAGYVFLKTKDFPNGEILRWEGGDKDDMCVQKTDISVVADGYDYPKAYTRRTLVPGSGVEETFYWKDFSTLKTNVELAKNVAELEERINNVAGEPIGVIKIWAGTGEAPDGYLYCNGAQYSKNGDKAKLYAVIGDTYNGVKDLNGKIENPDPGFFRVPDLRSRFIVGYNPNDSDYNTMGTVGGEKTHALTIAEMPSHNHTIDFCTRTDSGSGTSTKVTNLNLNVDPTEKYRKYVPTISAGSGIAHENRPPYYALAYIIKYK